MRKNGPEGRTPAGLSEDPLSENLRELRRLVHFRVMPFQTHIPPPMPEARSEVQEPSASFAMHPIDEPPTAVSEPILEVTRQGTEQREERASSGFLPRLFRAFAFRRS